MKKLVFLMFAMITTAAVMAQSDDNPPPAAGSARVARPRQTPEQRAKEATDKLNTIVQLSPDQAAKVLDINKNFFTQREALRANGAQTDGDDARNKMRTLGKEREDKINAVLTPDQLKKKQEARSQQQPRPGGAPKSGE